MQVVGLTSNRARVWFHIALVYGSVMCNSDFSTTEIRRKFFEHSNVSRMPRCQTLDRNQKNHLIGVQSVKLLCEEFFSPDKNQN